MPVTLGWCAIGVGPDPDFELFWNDTPISAPQSISFYPAGLDARFGLIDDPTTSVSYRISFTPFGAEVPSVVTEVTGAGAQTLPLSSGLGKGMWVVEALTGGPTNRLMLFGRPEYELIQAFQAKLKTTDDVVIGWGHVPPIDDIPRSTPCEPENEGSLSTFGLTPFNRMFMGLSSMGAMPSEVPGTAVFTPADGGPVLTIDFTILREEGWDLVPTVFGQSVWTDGTYTLTAGSNVLTMVVTGAGMYGAAAWFSENYVPTDPPDPPDPPDTFRGGWGGASGGVPIGQPTLASNAGTADFFAGMNWALGIDQTYPNPPMDGFDFTVVFTPADGGPVITQSFTASGPTYFGTDFFVMESVLTPVHGVYEIRIEVLGVLAQNKQVVVITDGGAYGVVAWYSEEEVPPIPAFWAALINAKEAV